MAVKLATGSYTPNQTRSVYHWPKPDANGDGDVVYEDKYDPQGNVYARDEMVDDQGNSIHHYYPPTGFINKQSFDNADTYVLADERGRVKRNANGHAYPIREGQALIIYPDGTFEHIEGDYAHTVFANSHTVVDEATVPSKSTKAGK